MRYYAILCALVALGLSTALAAAHQYKFGTLEIVHPHTRATPPGAKVAGGYLIIRNRGDTAERLTSATAEFAAKAEIHEMKMDGDVMRMRPLTGGLEIPAGGEVALEEGGLHFMFTGLKDQLNPGEMRKAKLVFERAGEIEIEFVVEGMDATVPHSGH